VLWTAARHPLRPCMCQRFATYHKINEGGNAFAFGASFYRICCFQAMGSRNFSEQVNYLERGNSMRSS
jgi:hypothetical protein